MQKHVKIYMTHFDYKGEEYIPCEICKGKSVDIHHVNGRGVGKNVISNLMALCRTCHNEIHNTSKYTRQEIQNIHNEFLSTNKLSYK